MTPGPEAVLRLLDGFELWVDGTLVHLAMSSQRMLAMTALGGAVQRCVLAGTLWPESPEDRARANLRTALWAVKQRCPSLTTTSAREVRLSPEVAVDVHRVRRAARRVIAVHRSLDSDHPDPWSPSLADLSGQELLPGWYDDWLSAEREQLRQLRLHALEALSAVLLRRNLHAEALEAALEAVRVDPLRESSNAAVIAAHVQERNVAEALRHYEHFRQRLWDELGCMPSDGLRDVLPRQARDHARRP